MILTRHEILKAVETGDIVIDPFDQSALDAASYDMTLYHRAAFHVETRLCKRAELYRASCGQLMNRIINARQLLLIVWASAVCRLLYRGYSYGKFQSCKQLET